MYVCVGGKPRKVGAVSSQFASELNLCVGGAAVSLRANVPGAGPLGAEGPAYALAPYATSVEERTRAVEGLVQGLVDMGAIPSHAIRNELQVTKSVQQYATHVLRNSPNISCDVSAATTYQVFFSAGC